MTRNTGAWLMLVLSVVIGAAAALSLQIWLMVLALLVFGLLLLVDNTEIFPKWK